MNNEINLQHDAAQSFASKDEARAAVLELICEEDIRDDLYSYTLVYEEKGRVQVLMLDFPAGLAGVVRDYYGFLTT